MASGLPRSRCRERAEEVQPPHRQHFCRLLPRQVAWATSAARRAQEDRQEEIPESGTKGRTWAPSVGIFGKQSQTGHWTAEN